MAGYDLFIGAVFGIFALDIVLPRLYQGAAWWFDHKAEHDELMEDDEDPPAAPV